MSSRFGRYTSPNSGSGGPAPSGVRGRAPRKKWRFLPQKQRNFSYFESSHTRTTHCNTQIEAHTTTTQHTGAAALHTLFIVHSCVFLRAGLLACRRPPSASYVRPASSCRTASNRPARHRCCYWPPHLDFQHQRDEPHRFSTGTIFHPLFLRAPPSKVSCAARRHLVSPRSGRKF